jgi:AhpD family alkylhydroperoxidase
MNNLSKLKALDEKSPVAMKDFWAFNDAAFADGTLSHQQKQLIALAVALTMQCPYCIAIYAKDARDAGATDTQLAEAAIVAAATRAGGAITHSSHLFQV